MEQSFTVASRPAGRGPLLVNVGVSGLVAVPHGSAVDLRDSAGQVVATYSGLRVLDERGKTVAASMKPLHGGDAIQITIKDGSADYPLVVDPTWSFVTEIVTPWADAVAVSGTTVVVGADSTENGGVGAAYVYSSAGGTWSQVAELTPSGGVSGDEFGSSVAVSGNSIVVGAPDHAVNGNTNQGAAYVFSGSGSNWSQAAILTASDGVAYDQFGASVAVSGTTAVVGAPYHSVGSNVNQGAGYVFSYSGSQWQQTIELEGSDGTQYDQFGFAVGLTEGAEGTILIVGAPNHTVSGTVEQGVVYLFSPDQGSWSQIGEVTASDGIAYERYGRSVAIDGDTAVVGAPFKTWGSLEGEAYVLTGRDYSGSWVQAATLTAQDEGSSDEFGYSVGISGPNLVIGSPNRTVNGNSNQGTVYTFYHTGSSWSQTQEIVASDGGPTDFFGVSAAIVGTTVIAVTLNRSLGGANAAMYVYSAGTELAPADGAEDDYYGWSVAISGTTAVVGAPDENVGSNPEQGMVYVYSLVGDVWLQTAEFSSSNGNAFDWFGSSVALSGTTMVIGAEFRPSGGVYVYTYSGGSWSQTAELSASDGQSGDEFGSSAAISGSTIAVAAPDHAVNGNTDQGAVYVYAQNGSGWTQAAELEASDGAASDSLGTRYLCPARRCWSARKTMPAAAGRARARHTSTATVAAPGRRRPSSHHQTERPATGSAVP